MSSGSRYSSLGMSTCFERRASSGASPSARAGTPSGGEVSGEEKNDQDLDELDRLEAEQVHLGIADPGPVPKRINPSDSASAPSKGTKLSLLNMRGTSRHAGDGQHDAGNRERLRVIGKGERIPEGIAQLTISARPVPVRRWRTGRIACSPSKPRMRQKTCTA